MNARLTRTRAAGQSIPLIALLIVVLTSFGCCAGDAGCCAWVVAISTAAAAMTGSIRFIVCIGS